MIAPGEEKCYPGKGGGRGGKLVPEGQAIPISFEGKIPAGDRDKVKYSGALSGLSSIMHDQMGIFFQPVSSVPRAQECQHILVY